MRFVSYNLLSLALRSSRSFPQCNPQDLQPAWCLESIQLFLKSILQDEQAHTVFGLQEVGLKWVRPLREFFKMHGYDFIHSCYGSKFTGYMGVAIAFPSQHAASFSKHHTIISAVDMVCVPQKFGHEGFSKWKAEQKRINSSWYRQSLKFLKDSLPFQPLLKRGRGQEIKPLPTMITYRFNRAIFATITTAHDAPIDEPFAFGTYHMPCKFQYPTVMAVHLRLFFKALQSYCVEHDLTQFVVAMDANCEPGSLPYRSVVNVQTLSEEEVAQIDQVSPGIMAPTKMCRPLNSELLGSESLDEFVAGMKHAYPSDSISNYTVGFTGHEFCGKIDYIWYKFDPDLNELGDNDGNPKGVPMEHELSPDPEFAPVQTRDTQHQYLPNASQPSDHYPLVASID